MEKPKTTAQVKTDPPVLLSMVAEPVELPALAKAIPAVDPSGLAREWYVDDLVQRLALNGACTIFYFIMDRLGPPPRLGLHHGAGPRRHHPHLRGAHRGV